MTVPKRLSLLTDGTSVDCLGKNYFKIAQPRQLLFKRVLTNLISVKYCVCKYVQYINIRGCVTTGIAVALYKKKESNFSIFGVKSFFKRH